MEEIARACLNQSATSTAQELVIFVTRQDLFRKRARMALEFERGNVERNSPKEKKEKITALFNPANRRAGSRSK